MRLMYRSVSREFAAKHHAVAVFLEQGIGDDPEAMKIHVFPQMVFAMGLLEHKLEIEGTLASGNYSDYEHRVFDLEDRPPFIGAATFLPAVTPRGRVLEANSSQMTLTLLPRKNGGLALLSWNRVGNPCAEKFAHALCKTPLHHLGMAIGRMLFEMSDNVVFSPLYWFGLPEACKQMIMNMHARSIVNRETVPPADALVPDYRTDYPFALKVRSIHGVE